MSQEKQNQNHQRPQEHSHWQPHASEVDPDDLSTRGDSLAEITRQAHNDPATFSARTVLSLQRTVGNQATQSILKTHYALQRELSKDEGARFDEIEAAVKKNHAWEATPSLVEVLTQLRSLASDDPSTVQELYSVFVTQKVKLIGIAEAGSGGHYDYQLNEMSINNQTAFEMADTMIFETGNARRQGQFKESDVAFREGREGGFQLKGQMVADIEAETTLDYLDHLINIIKVGGKTLAQLPPGAKRQYLYFMDKYPDYFNMDARRKQEFRETYKAEMRTSPHEARAAAGTRMQLSSQDLYSYEMVTDKLNISGVMGRAKTYTEAALGRKLSVAQWNSSGGAISSNKAPMFRVITEIPAEARGAFYICVVERAETYYGVDLGDIKFNAAQETVARNEAGRAFTALNFGFDGPGGTWRL